MRARWRRERRPGAASPITACRAAIIVALAVGSAHAADEAWIRLNNVGYLPDDHKVAVLSSDAPLSGRFRAGDYEADIGPDQGAWGPFQHNYRLDFGALRTPGRYVIRVGNVVSRPFVIDAGAYREVPQKLLDFMGLQRCGDNPVTGRKCHQQDGIDTATGQRVDLVGGWHDAADRLKHMLTTSYCVAVLYLAGEKTEADYGARLLAKIHPDPSTLYVQIGDDRDHLPPEGLWHEDQTDYGWGAGGPRAAWRATGKPEGPKYHNESSGLANLAGRAAAALALAGEVSKAESLYRLALATPGCAMSVPVRAPYYYRESDYFDDLEWAATELWVATGRREYLQEALEHAQRAGSSAWMGQPSHAHYEFFPYVNLGHWRLHAHADSATRAKLAAYYREGLERVRAVAEQNPYRLGTPQVWCSTNDVVAVATQAVLYERMTGDRTYRGLATECRDWIFGRNPWGRSFVIGVPAADREATGVPGDEHPAATQPHHLFFKLKNRLPVGGLVDGPVRREINESLKYASFGEDRLARFQSDVAVYHDVFADFSTNEPTIDGTTSLLLLLRVWQLRSDLDEDASSVEPDHRHKPEQVVQDRVRQ